MNFKNRFRLIILSMILLLTSISAIAFFGIRGANSQVEEALRLDDLLVDLYELRILNSEYFASPSERVKQQWLRSYERINKKVVLHEAIPDDVKDALTGLQDIFQRFTKMPEGAEPQQKRLRNQIATTLNLESQRIIDWAADISGKVKAGILPHLVYTGTLMLIIILFISLVTISIILITTRRVLSSINRIKDGATEISSGNMGFQIENTGNDEITTLTSAINRMSNDLVESYTNLHDQTVQLEAEMAKSQVANEELLIKKLELEEEVEERQAIQQNLEEQTVILEEEVAERIKIQQEHDRLEAQLLQSQKMEAIGLLAGGVAHDFNNILSVIMGYSDLLLAGLSEGKMHDNAIQILKASERAADLTKGLLAFSRKQAFNLEIAEINQLVTNNCKFLQRVIGEDIELVTNYHPAPLHALLDRSQLQQVLMNLATNARDAMHSGGKLTLGISAEILDNAFIAAQGYGNPGVHAVIRVSDSGTGMSSETVERIFEPFFTTKEKDKGTGLGLSIIHGIIAQHNGFIRCKSQPGDGTTFAIYLPVCEKCGDAAAEGIEMEKASLRGNETILLAEDDEMLLEITASSLESKGYKVIRAGDGTEAVALFAEHADEIKLVLLDAIMPKMTGKQAWDEIKELRPNVKACFVSGYTNEIISGKLAVDFSVPFVSKPVMPEILLQKVRDILDGR